MDLASILVYLDSSRRSHQHIAVSVVLASAFDAHVHALHADPATQHDCPSPDAEIVRRAFLGVIEDAPIEGSWHATHGDPVQRLVHESRAVDLLVLGQHTFLGKEGDNLPALGSCILAAGRPVLVIPAHGWIRERPGRKVLVAWNGSRESTRALRDSLPLLRRASSVELVHFREHGTRNPHADHQPMHHQTHHETHQRVRHEAHQEAHQEPHQEPHREARRERGAVGASPGHADPDTCVAHDTHDIPAQYALAWLARHGVTARALTCALGAGQDAGDAILSHASDTEADLIVSGAYGHGPWREAVFGGVTRTLLRAMTVPVMFSH